MFKSAVRNTECLLVCVLDGKVGKRSSWSCHSRIREHLVADSLLAWRKLPLPLLMWSCSQKNVSQLSSYFSNYFLCFKRHNFISLTTLMLSSSANMFHTSIGTTPYHSQILIWIRLCHDRVLRKWGFFPPPLFSPHSFFVPSLPVTSPCCLLTGSLMCLL